MLDEPARLERAWPSGVDLAELLALPADPLAELDPELLADIDRLDPSDELDPADLVPVGRLPIELEREYAGVAAHVEAFAELCASLDEAEQAQFAANRAMAAQLAATRAALDIASRNPAVYLLPSEIGRSGASDLAVRAAAAELSMRLHVPAGTIRSRAYEATVLQDRLPAVWAAFADGTVTYTDARVAAETAAGFPTGDARLLELDRALAEVIGSVTTAQLRRRARTIRAKLERDLLQERHARAFTERRVVTEYVDDGMGWLHLYTSQVEIAKITARLDKTARRDHGLPDETRTCDQLRADAATAWLTGAGTPTAARVEVLVTVPLLPLANLAVGTATECGNAASIAPGLRSAAEGTATEAGDADPLLTAARQQLAMLDGVGPIDDATARRLFAEAPSFLRLAVDPVTAAPLRLDRTRYRPTKQQRIWLALLHATCSRPGCNRLAYTVDIDHIGDWIRQGLTNPENLCPLCRGDHRLKHATLLTPTKNPDSTVTWSSPTGRQYTDPPPF